MRENRPYGLEGGESGKPDFPTPMPYVNGIWGGPGGEWGVLLTIF